MPEGKRRPYTRNISTGSHNYKSPKSKAKRDNRPEKHSLKRLLAKNKKNSKKPKLDVDPDDLAELDRRTRFEVIAERQAQMRKRPSDEPEAGPSSKQPFDIDEFANDMYESEMADLPSDGAALPSANQGAGGTAAQIAGDAGGQGYLAGGSTGGGGSMRGAAPLWSGVERHPHTHTRVYKKQYFLRVSWDNVKYFKIADPANIAKSDSYIIYPIIEFPWEYLGMYLTEDEIAEVLSGKYTRVRVKEVNVDVANATAILNFDVGSSVATVGNNNVGFRAAQMKNMRGQRIGRYFTAPQNVIKGTFWGSHAFTLPQTSGIVDTGLARLGAAFVTRNYSNKFCHWFTPLQNQSITTPATYRESTQYNVSAFDWNAFKKERRNVSMNEGHWFSQSFKPKSGYIFGCEQHSDLQIYSRDWGQQKSEMWVTHPHRLMAFNSPINAYRTTGSNGTIDYYANPSAQDISIINPTGNLQNNVSGANVDDPLSITTLAHIPVPRISYIATSSDYRAQLRIDRAEILDPTSLTSPNQDSSPQETLAIGLDLLIANTADNQTIQGWMELVLTCHCELEVTEGNCAPFYPHAGSGAYPNQYPMPFTFSPKMTAGAYSYPAENGPVKVVYSDINVSNPIERGTHYADQVKFQTGDLVDITAGNPIVPAGVQTRSMRKKGKQPHIALQGISTSKVEYIDSDSDSSSSSTKKQKKSVIATPQDHKNFIEKYSKLSEKTNKTLNTISQINKIL